MKQEQFKHVYQQICLTEAQKDMLWKRIGTAQKRASICPRAYLPTRFAACFAVLLLSGMTVLAANELSLMDKITDAMNLLTQNKEALSEEQKNIYAEYGQVLDIAIELDSGTLTLDAALYDESHLLIPFRYSFHANVTASEILTAGTELNQTDLRQMKKIYELDTDSFMQQFNFCVDREIRHPDLSRYLITSPVIAEDQTISGSFLLSVDEYPYFSQGNVIELVRLAEAGDATTENSSSVPYTKFVLEKTLEQRELTIDTKNAEALQNMGLSIERMTLSPLSLCYSGKGTHTKALSASVTLILKDGSVVENSPTGSGYSLHDANQNNTDFSFFASRLFAVPVLLEDVAEIHIQNYQGTDIHIPVA